MLKLNVTRRTALLEAPLGKSRKVSSEPREKLAKTNHTGGTDTEHDPRNSAENFDPAVAEAWRVYNQARDAYREIFGNIIKAHNLVLKVSWLETSRPEEWRIIKHAQMLGKIDEFITPVIHHARDLSQYFTRHIRDFFGTKLAKGEESGTRTLRPIVINRLRPTYGLDGSQLPSLLTSANAVPQVIIGSG